MPFLPSSSSTNPLTADQTNPAHAWLADVRTAYERQRAAHQGEEADHLDFATGSEATHLDIDALAYRLLHSDALLNYGFLEAALGHRVIRRNCRRWRDTVLRRRTTPSEIRRFLGFVDC